jgi:long-chain acyl-CoA synthetase
MKKALAKYQFRSTMSSSLFEASFCQELEGSGILPLNLDCYGIDFMMKDVETYSDIYRKVFTRFSNPTALCDRDNGDWREQSTQEFLEAVKFLSLGLRELGFKRGDTLGLLGNSSSEWVSLDFAAILVGGVTVPFFANISEKNFGFQIQDADVKFFFVDGSEEWEVLQKHCQYFKSIIRKDVSAESASKTPMVEPYQALIEMGRKRYETNPQEFELLLREPRSEDLATIIYTSGSTGVPKGVELTHMSLVANVRAAQAVLPPEMGIEKALSCLPIAHIFERSIVLFYLCSNVSLYLVDDIQKTGDFAREIKPDMITMVPRLLEKVYDKMVQGVEDASGIKRLLGRLALGLARGKSSALKQALRCPLDRVVYSKFRDGLGGRLKLIISGGAPLSGELCEFFPGIGIPVHQGYGMTECPFISTNIPGRNESGSVGKPFPGLEVSLSAEKEILVRGPAVMKGYHNRPEENQRTLESGWLHTGDRGAWTSSGFLMISGRIKEFLKTSNGKYVSPVPIEHELCRSSLVETAMVVAEGRNFPSCLLFLNEEEIKRRHPKDHQRVKGDHSRLGEAFNPEIEGLIEGVNQNLNKWERLKKFRLIPRPASVECGELTPTMKLKRYAVVDKYREIIDSMYGEVGKQA